MSSSSDNGCWIVVVAVLVIMFVVNVVSWIYNKILIPIGEFFVSIIPILLTLASLAALVGLVYLITNYIIPWVKEVVENRREKRVERQKQSEEDQKKWEEKIEQNRWEYEWGQTDYAKVLSDLIVAEKYALDRIKKTKVAIKTNRVSLLKYTEIFENAEEISEEGYERLNRVNQAIDVRTEAIKTFEKGLELLYLKKQDLVEAKNDFLRLKAVDTSAEADRFLEDVRESFLKDVHETIIKGSDDLLVLHKNNPYGRDYFYEQFQDKLELLAPKELLKIFKKDDNEFV